MAFSFNKELNTNIDIVLQELAVFLRGKQGVFRIQKNARLSWFFDLRGFETLLPAQVKRLGTIHEEETFDKPVFWIIRPLIKENKGVRIAGRVVENFDQLAWESLAEENSPFFLEIELSVSQFSPLSSMGKIISVEIRTDSELVAQRVANWLGGVVNKKRIPTQIYEDELKYIFRPPISYENYFPLGVLNPIRENSQKILSDSGEIANHLLICGQTGYGKTNTTFLVLDQIISNVRLSGLLLLDIKGEYYSWAENHGFSFLKVAQHPHLLKSLKINPFIPPDTVSLSVHVDHLSQVFSVASFGGAGLVLPSYMRLFLYEFFKSYWKISENIFAEVLYYNGLVLRNQGLRFYQPDSTQSILESLIHFWETNQKEVLNKIFSGNTGRQVADIAGILSGRIKSLAYGLVRFFDYSETARSFETMFHKKVILSFQGASSEQINFLTSLFALLYTHSAAFQKESGSLKNLLVIEEAHRIMGRETLQGEGLTTETELAKMMQEALSELRSKGIGIIIIDQSPANLISGVIANTGTKIIHRLSSPVDQEILLQSIGWPENYDLTRFERGECLIKSSHPVIQHVQLPVWKR